MFTPAAVERILFLDIETAPIAPTYDELSPRMQALWDLKSQRYRRQEEHTASSDIFLDKAGIHAEFAQVVCISCGYVRFETKDKPVLKMKSYVGADETEILTAFGDMLNKWVRSKDKRNNGPRTVCAHNGKEFDFPFLGRRFLINQLSLPDALQLQGKKPWEIALLDTMELWKFGDYKSYTSLDLMAAVLDIPSPKDDMDGSQVRAVFWEEKDYQRIEQYCEKDVITTVQVVLRMSRLPLVDAVMGTN